MAENVNNGRDIKLDDGQIIPNLMSEDRLYGTMSKAVVNAEFAKDAEQYKFNPFEVAKPATFDPDANKHIDYFQPKQEHDPKWDCYDSADYADYSTYPTAITDQLRDYPDSFAKALLPSDVLVLFNKVFASAGMRALDRAELPDFPKDNDAIKGWDMKWTYKHTFLQPVFLWLSFDTRQLDELKTRIRAVHLKLIQLAKENAKLAGRPPEGHSVTMGYYEDPATADKISTPANAPGYLATFIELKNEHRARLKDSEYQDRYLAARGVICACCGHPMEAAVTWPVDGVKMRTYHSGAGVPMVCTACRNTINSTLARTGPYRILPEPTKDYIEDIINAHGGKATLSDIVDATELVFLSTLIDQGRQAAVASAKAAASKGSSLAELKAKHAHLLNS
jgi:hypothetical protein